MQLWSREVFSADLFKNVTVFYSTGELIREANDNDNTQNKRNNLI